MRLRFVADGPRDEVVLPPIVGRVLDVRVAPTFSAWKTLRVNGYERKLIFAHRQAIDAGEAGMVAVVDQDREARGSRIRALRAGRESERSRAPDLPIAIGQAVPHLEAWLLDDEVAIRRGLGLATDHPVPNVGRCKDPKSAIEALRRAGSSPHEPILEALGRVAVELDLRRCAHAKRTGFADFHEDVTHELGPVAGGTTT